MITTEFNIQRFGGFVVALLVMLLLLPADALASKRSDTARLSRITDETYVLAEGDVEWSFAEPNLTLEKGDLLQTNETGMAEIQFDSSLVLRIGENSRVALIETGDERVVGIERGRAYIRALRDVSSDEYLNLTFPSGQLLITEKTLARIDILEDGRAELRVIRGKLELEPMSESSGRVEEGERVLISPEGITQYEPLELAKVDDFDKWNEERDIAMSTYRRPEYIEDDIVGSEELEDYGEWVYMKNYKTYAWRPYVVSEWRPYYYGRWYHSRHRGWIWIPEEPWGYATHHYGSWNYDPYYKWIWIPSPYWQPAYVHWVEYDDYIGWVPIGYYGRPVITVYPYYVSGLYIDYFDSFSFTFVFRSHFHDYRHHHYRNHHRHAYDHRRDDRRHDGKRHTDVIDHTTRPERIVKGKVRFVKDIDKVDLRKDTCKGRMVRERLDYRKILDVERHPKMERRVARLDEMERRHEKRSTITNTDELPRRRINDETRRFDYRERVGKHEKVPVRRDVRIEPTPDQKERRRIDMDTRGKDRERIEMRRPERRMPERPAIEQKDRTQERTLDKPLSRNRDRWDISNVKRTDGELQRKRERIADKPSRPEQKDRPRHEMVPRERDNVRRVDREQRMDRQLPPAQEVRSERPQRFQERIVREMPRQEVPRRQAFEGRERVQGEADRQVSTERNARFQSRDSGSKGRMNSPRSFGRNR